MSEYLRPLKIGVSRKQKKRIWRFLPIFLIVVVIISLIVFLNKSSGSSSTSVFNYIFSGTSLNSTDGKVNVLLLGIAGGIHDGSSLTDTILIASINIKTNQVFLISIPRDLWLPSLKTKANAVYQIGLSQKNGLGLAKTAL